ncbi:MAG: chemotaxis-specific protein-glutamate methyltransferase CheB [Myxococcales bacterium]|jgi:two-component system chemotaxis response regulator CheB
MIRVVVAEDLPTARQLLVALLESDPEIEVVGEAADGLEAVELTSRLGPDLVTMDILMPRLDGFEATRRIMAERPTPIVIVSSLDVQEVGFTMQALQAGALAALPKPRGPGSPGFEEDSRRLLTTVKAMSKVTLLQHRGQPEAAPARPPAPPRLRGVVKVRVVAMAGSAGGPAAFKEILSQLPADYGPSILLVQHIALGFAEGFARWLDSSSPLRVKVAEQGEPLAAATVYVAPDDRHLGLAAGGAAIELSDDAPVEGFRPAASHLFKSVAGRLGPYAAAVILSGAGHDGVEGLKAARQAGCFVIAQDEATSLVFGMPGAAIEAGVVDEVLALPAVAERLKDIG